MKVVTFFCSLWLLGIGGAISAENDATAFHVQLIRGTDDAKPREASWKPVSAKVNKKLSAAFRPRQYWEINRVTLNVSPGKPVKTQLSADRTVEIQLLESGEAEARLYFQGKLLRKCRQATHDKICIMGGTRETDESWFVAVSREKPD
jgi:hypothetical protein